MAFYPPGHICQFVFHHNLIDIVAKSQLLAQENPAFKPLVIVGPAVMNVTWERPILTPFIPENFPSLKCSQQAPSQILTTQRYAWHRAGHLTGSWKRGLELLPNRRADLYLMDHHQGTFPPNKCQNLSSSGSEGIQLLLVSS